MFNFLYSEVWWMNTIIAALITGMVALIGSYFMYLGKTNKILDKIADLKEATSKHSEGHTGLSIEHAGLAKEHADLSKEHLMIQNAIHQIEAISEKTGKTVTDIGYGIREEKNLAKMRNEAMTSDQQKLEDTITKGVESISALKEKFASVILENKELREQLTTKKEEMQKFFDNRYHSQLQSKDATIERLGEKVDKLCAENVKFAKECQRLSQHHNRARNDWEMEL